MCRKCVRLDDPWAAMRLRVKDPDERLELLHYLRASGCIAYLVDDQTIEALVSGGAGDGIAIMGLVDDWRARRARARRFDETA
jgi:hypothetical protein